MITLLMLACTSTPPVDSGSSDSGVDSDPPAASHNAHPLDDTLRLNHIQVKGTHNSYHVQPETSIPDWDYTHPPLTEQLEQWGVRQFELDLHLAEDGTVRVYHVTTFDEGTQCATLTLCLSELRAWSDTHRGHVPITVFFEIKDETDDIKFDREAYIALDELLAASWPDSRRLTPGKLTRDHRTLRESIAVDGWPTLGEVRGGVMFVLLDGAEDRSNYLAEPTSPVGRQLFVYDRGGEPEGVVAGLDNPYDEAAITAAHDQSRMIRTRGDSVTEPDADRGVVALASGAHWVTTDWPTDEAAYQLDIPSGTPARCNPVTAPPGCASTDIEDPARLQ